MMAADGGAMWHIQMFHGLKVQRGARSVDHFDTRRAASLLAYLAFYPHRAHPREELAEMLWPDEDMDVTRLRLRQVLNTIRRALDSPDSAKDGLLLSDRTFVRVNADLLLTDVREFETLRKAAMQAEEGSRRVDKLHQAADLYRGDLLPGFYEDWVERERRRLQEAFRETLLLLAASLAEIGDPQAGLECLRKLIAADALDEEANHAYIRLCAQAGRPAEALRQYQTLEQGLWKELRTLPAPELQAQIVQIRQANAALTPSTANISRAFGSNVPASQSRSVPASSPPMRKDASGAQEAMKEQDARVAQAAVVSAVSAQPIAVSLTPFFGRQQEIQNLVALLRPPDALLDAQASDIQVSDKNGQRDHAPRLVTLVGPGGSGKTRLALEVGRQLQPLYAQRAWFVSLADIVDGARLPEKLAEAIYPDNPQSDRALEQVVEALNRQPALLVLDNFEQLTATGVPVVRQLLERTPGVRCLVTSRLTLNLGGERRFDVPPLPTPDLRETWEGAERAWQAVAPEAGTRQEVFKETASDMRAREQWQRVAQTPSVQLFADRARNVQPDFEITADNAADVAQLCRYLEGFPLALELAAAWMSVLNPVQLLLRLQDRFNLLVNQEEDAPARHRSLYATLDWSYEQLAPPVQELFAALSVFHNGWTLDAAEALGNDARTLPDLIQLLRHSLILRESAETGGRFRMLETMRDFARSRMVSEREDALRQRHAAYYLSFAECASAHLTGAEQSRWLERMQEENENLRAALSWCKETAGHASNNTNSNKSNSNSGQGQYPNSVPATSHQPPTLNPIEMGLRFIVALWRFWDVRNYYQEAEEWIETFLSPGFEAGPALLARALEGAGALGLSKRSYALAQQRVEQSIRLFEQLGDTRGLGSALSVLAAIVRDQGDTSTAKHLFQKSLALMREHRDTFGIARALGGLGVIADWEGDAISAHALLEQSAAMYRICGHRKGLAWCCYERGKVAYRQGNSEQRLALFLEGLPISRALRDSENIGFACFNIGAVYQHSGEYGQAEAVGLEALRAAQQSGLITREVGNLFWLGDLACEQGDYVRGEDYYKAAITRGAQAQFPDGTGQLLQRLAYLALLRGDVERAVCLYSAAESHEAELLDIPNEARFLSADAQQQLQQRCAAPELAAVRRRGLSLSREQSCDLALEMSDSSAGNKP